MIRTKYLFLPILLIGIIYLMGMNACVHEPIVPEPMDSMPIDSMPVDTMPIDTMPVDTMPIDTMPVDTGMTATCSPDSVYYEQDIVPLLIRNDCRACHTAANNLGGVVLESYESLINSNIIDLEDPANSLLITIIQEEDENKVMPPPPDPRMSEFEIEVLLRWIEQGALNNACELDGCDLSNLDYTTKVLPILQDNACMACHTEGADPGGGVVLNTESGLLKAVRDGSFYGAIAHLPGYSKMPQGGDQLDECDILLIKNWIYTVVKL